MAPVTDEADTRDGRWSQYRALKAQGLSPAQIAVQCGVSRRTVREALKPRPPSPPEILRDDGTPCPCHYCGNPARVVDVIRRGVSTSGDIGELRTPACAECRSFATRSRERVLSLRKAAVKRQLRHRYGDRLTVPEWTHAELAELAPNFAAFVNKSLAQRDEIRDRLAW